MALRHGKGGAPAWLTALQLAEAWGGHPEDHMQRPRGILWAARQAAYKEQRAKVRRMTEGT